MRNRRVELLSKPRRMQSDSAQQEFMKPARWNSGGTGCVKRGLVLAISDEKAAVLAVAATKLRTVSNGLQQDLVALG